MGGAGGGPARAEWGTRRARGHARPARGGPSRVRIPRCDSFHRPGLSLPGCEMGRGAFPGGRDDPPGSWTQSSRVCCSVCLELNRPPPTGPAGARVTRHTACPGPRQPGLVLEGRDAAQRGVCGAGRAAETGRAPPPHPFPGEGAGARGWQRVAARSRSPGWRAAAPGWSDVPEGAVGLGVIRTGEKIPAAATGVSVTVCRVGRCLRVRPSNWKKTGVGGPGGCWLALPSCYLTWQHSTWEIKKLKIRSIHSLAKVY